MTEAQGMNNMGMNQAVVIGVGMTKFGKHLERSSQELAKEALDAALADAGIECSRIEAAFVANAAAGSIWGQENIRGQVFLKGSGLEGIPIINVENACASASTAFQLAVQAVMGGQYETVLAIGVEKMFHPDKRRTFRAFQGAVDIEELVSVPGGGMKDNQSMFMDIYASEAQRHMDLYGTKVETFAQIAVKNSRHGSLNPYAQYRTPQTLETVLQSRMISEPVTLLMCSPLSDGAAAAIISTERTARQLGKKPVFVSASVILSGDPQAIEQGISNTERATKKAYHQAGVTPEDLDLVELHDACAPGELWAYEHLGLCPPGEGAKLVESGATALGGTIPVNPSGGLISRGHPIGATGLAQIAEVVWQLRREAGQRQVDGEPRVGLTHNVGGYLYGDTAVVSVHILTR